MTSELADKVEIIRKTFPILLHDDEFQDGTMHVSLQYSECGNIVQANLRWDCNTSLEDFVNNTCCNEHHLPIYLKESITHQLYQLIQERQLIRNDQITCDFFQSTFRVSNHIEEFNNNNNNGFNNDNYQSDSDGSDKNQSDESYDSEQDDEDLDYSSDENSNDSEQYDDSEEDDSTLNNDLLQNISANNTSTESTIIDTEKHPMNFSQFYKVFHSTSANQITLTKVSNDLKCVYQDKYQERDRGINQIQKEHRDGVEQNNERIDQVQQMVLDHMKELEEFEEKWNLELSQLKMNIKETFWNFVNDLEKDDEKSKSSSSTSKNKQSNMVKNKEEILFPGFKLMEPRGKQFEIQLRNELQDKSNVQIISKFAYLTNVLKRLKKQSSTNSPKVTVKDPWTLVEDYDAIETINSNGVTNTSSSTTTTSSSSSSSALNSSSTVQEQIKSGINSIKIFMKSLFRDGRLLTDIPRLIQNERFHVLSIYKKIERMYLESDEIFSPYDDSFVFIEDGNEREDQNKRLCGRIFVIYSADMSDCISKNYKKDEEERDYEEDYLLFKTRHLYNMYQSRLNALVVSCCIHDHNDDDTHEEENDMMVNQQVLSWTMRDMERISFECNHGQGPDFHFPSLDDQISQLKRDIKRKLKRRQEKVDLGDYYLTKHSNLSYANCLFHMVAQLDSKKDQNLDDYNKILQSYSNIMDECRNMGIRNLSIQLPLSLSYRHPKIDGNLPNGDTIILQIRDIMKIYLKKQKEFGSWFLPNLFFYCPKNPKHSSGDFQCQCHYSILKTSDDILQHSSNEISSSSDNRYEESHNENDNLHKYIVEPFFKSYLNSNIQLPPSWMQ